MIRKTQNYKKSFFKAKALVLGSFGSRTSPFVGRSPKFILASLILLTKNSPIISQVNHWVLKELVSCVLLLQFNIMILF